MLRFLQQEKGGYAMDVRAFGRFIAARRVELGLTQAELAETLHVTNKAISKWENGRGLPDIANVECLAGALKLSLQELMECRVDESKSQEGGEEEALRKTLDFAQIKIKKATHICIPTLYRPPKVRPKNLTIGGRYFYGKIQLRI